MDISTETEELIARRDLLKAIKTVLGELDVTSMTGPEVQKYFLDILDEGIKGKKRKGVLIQ